jgi:hypothetical protein
LSLTTGSDPGFCFAVLCGFAKNFYFRLGGFFSLRFCFSSKFLKVLRTTYFIKIIFQIIFHFCRGSSLGFWEIYMLEKNPQQLFIANRLSYSLLTQNTSGIVHIAIITDTAVATVVAMAVAMAVATVVATAADITTTMEAY